MVLPPFAVQALCKSSGFDAGVRIAEAVPQDLITDSIGGDIRMIAVGAPDHIEEHGVPKVPADLLHHRCIRALLATGAMWHREFEKRSEVAEIDVPGALTLCDETPMSEAAVVGAGLAHMNE